MPKTFKHELLFLWKDILLWPAGEIIGFFVFLHFIDFLLDLFAAGLREKWGIKMLISSISWQTEINIALVGLIMLILLSSYRSLSRLEKGLDLLRDGDFISLKEACDRLKEEQNRRFGESIDSDFQSLDTYKLYNTLANYFVEVDDIYGKSPSSSFREWRTINKDKILLGEIKLEEGELVLYGPGNYVGKTPEYIGLALKKANLIEDIGKIIANFFMSLKEAVQKLYDKSNERPLFKRFIEKSITGQFPTRNEVWRVLANHFVSNSSIDIYGKDKYSSELRIINKGQFGSMYFDNEASDLYMLDGKEPVYTDISVKKEEVERAITEIIDLTEGIYK